ncbi:Oidioi.mRNA.OKI2018_I69.PAR.g10256.t1.cds [Oikopleura dioica]|uniref:Oidioi.mRNA.OKI2018_I69.PAR.g10256.t1.cds n=1 Tax=Oikopleura dioica TaxID=34765 RepID=A0ABN7RVJ4_OIKDI|nr:Oidioi.mRNA.OKI2018_I69.PAR.g10256.t1.cds [Oikopleura dioica]
MTWYYYMVLRFRETYDSLSPYIGLREPRADSITMEADTGFILGIVSSVLSFIGGFLMISGSLFRKNDHLKHILRDRQSDREYADAPHNEGFQNPAMDEELNEDVFGGDYIPSMTTNFDRNYDVFIPSGLVEDHDYVNVHPNNHNLRMSFNQSNL